MKITISGSGCSKCRALYATVESALNEKKINAELVKEENLSLIHISEPTRH